MHTYLNGWGAWPLLVRSDGVGRCFESGWKRKNCVFPLPMSLVCINFVDKLLGHGAVRCPIGIRPTVYADNILTQSNHRL